MTITLSLYTIIVGIIYLYFSFVALLILLILGVYFNNKKDIGKGVQGFLKVFPYLLIAIAISEAVVLWLILF